MKTHHKLVIILLLHFSCALTAFAQDKSNELKQRILAQAQSMTSEDYAFTRTARSNQTQGGKPEQHVTIDKFDPTKPAEARWTLVSVDGAPPLADVLKKFQTDSQKRRIPGYYRLAHYFGTPATASTDSRGRTVFRFASLPKDTAILMDSDLSSNSTSDATVGEANGVPFVEQVHLTVRPMRIKLLMKLDSYEYTARYRMGPEGKPLLMEQISNMSGSGMGQTGQIHSVTTYSDYRATGKKP